MNKSFGELVRRAMEKLHPEFPLIETIIETIIVRPQNTGEPAECWCTLTYGKKEVRHASSSLTLRSYDVEFTELGKLTKSHRHEPMTPEYVAEKLWTWVEDRKKYKALEEERHALSKRAARAIAAVERELPTAVGTKLVAYPAIDVLGLGELKVVNVKYDPTEPVFVVSGEFTVAALKQLLAGTLFHLKLDVAPDLTTKQVSP